ncbi:PhoX family protein [Paenibacillus protaetiae]|uniref:DUF839 domain-containing protein n=1 Tax=Paenibacillus protaetiae TaxID=2509456 RepID=A0A4P6FD56_9BACL|nr:alkaline phosphatase PhoX [Paenibacillus protaetiae]QAY68488.1 DUF839 domain-containing protein [Paenibacillus protaetiae]
MNPNKEVSRRSFLAMIGTGTAALAAASTGLTPLLETAEASAGKLLGLPAALPFPALQPQTANKLAVPAGYAFDSLASSGAGYIGYWAVPADSGQEELLWVSHPADAPQDERGISVLSVKRAPGRGAWSAVSQRRITATERVRLTGPASGSKALHSAAAVQGLWSNGSGGRTPWGTALAGEQAADAGAVKAGIAPSATGWIAEADPADSRFAVRKHTALGRFTRGDAVAAITRSKRVAVYMCSGLTLFKFVSSGQYDAARGKENAELLESGKLYAADLGRGSWIELTADAVRGKLSDPAFQMPAAASRLREDLLEDIREQADVLVYAQEAALVLGATVLEQAFGLALHPADQSLFIAQTGSAANGHGFGSVLRLAEKDSDAGAERFESDLAVSGSRLSGFSSPRSLAFDTEGRLWLATAIPQGHMHEGAYASFGNNALLVLAPSGASLGQAEAFAYAPVKGIFAAPAFGPGSTLFTSVQGTGVIAIRNS